MTGEDGGESERALKQEEPLLKPQNLTIRTIRAALSSGPRAGVRLTGATSRWGPTPSCEDGRRTGGHEKNATTHQRSESRLNAGTASTFRTRKNFQMVHEPVPAPGPPSAHTAQGTQAKQETTETTLRVLRKVRRDVTRSERRERCLFN